MEPTSLAKQVEVSGHRTLNEPSTLVHCEWRVSYDGRQQCGGDDPDIATPLITSAGQRAPPRYTLTWRKRSGLHSYIKRKREAGICCVSGVLASRDSADCVRRGLGRPRGPPQRDTSRILCRASPVRLGRNFYTILLESVWNAIRSQRRSRPFTTPCRLSLVQKAAARRGGGYVVPLSLATDRNKFYGGEIIGFARHRRR
ncbi:hypothetical protein EVAR_50731_1 [Eumeta japonica]|uniref:Uncharacterized protein n=1 Tax=Eumeta variegata TaxID=151549 RepID=A0A4C1YQ59_EUMVA|nr:hypothetical protein EVAR_50731_1 [Eumeta japonica]